MTINASDIKLLESEVMTDASDGGGRRTTHVIPDGVSGNIFPKVSRLDTVYGRLNLRKVFGHVDSGNVDTYAGAHAIITDPPTNPKIGVVLFGTGNDFDTRTTARDRIESYVVSGPESRLRLYGQQPLGAKAVLCYQRSTESLPDIGDVYALVQENSSGTILRTQYVRISSIDQYPQTFEDDRGTYDYNVVVLGITAPLEYSFAGPDTPPRNSSVARLGKVRGTSVADAARYFGIQPITAVASAGDLSVYVESIYAPLVPTTQRESAISLASIAGSRQILDAGATMEVRVEYMTSAGIRFPAGLQPGTVRWGTAVEDGNGRIDVSFLGPGRYANIDYEAGLLTSPQEFPTGNNPITAAHAVAVGQPGHTASEDVTLSTRGTVYSKVLSPPPAPYSLVVDYRALGKWYRLRDEDGTGALRGFDASIGAGTVDYVTGAVVITLGALPDVGSAVLWSWGSEVHYVQRAGANASTSPLVQKIQLARYPVIPESVTVEYFQNFTYTLTTITFNSAGVGTATPASSTTATLDRYAGVITISYQHLPAPDRTVKVNYAYSVTDIGSPEPVQETQNFQVGGLSVIELGKEIQPGTLRVSLPVAGSITSGAPGVGYVALRGSVLCKDNGDGQLVSTISSVPTDRSYGGLTTRSVFVDDEIVVGDINYSTGTVGILGVMPVSGKVWQPALGVRIADWVDGTGSVVRVGPGSGNPDAIARYMPVGATSTPATEEEEFTYEDAPFVFNITHRIGEPVVPGSVLFSVAPITTAYTERNAFVDRAGTIVRAVNPSTGVGVSSGEINYETGEVRLHSWTTGETAYMTSTTTVRSCLTYRGNFVTDRIQFRTSGSPVRGGSLYVQVLSEDGTQLSGVADVNGSVTGVKVAGTVNQDMGVVSLRFGEWKPVAGNAGEPWYSADYVDPNDPTRVWKPTLVLPGTLRYSAVVTSNVALDARILGVDPVRLPLDGRVPVVRPGDVAVLHNTQDYSLPNPAAAGATYDVGRGDLSDLWLVDADGVRIDAALYTADLNAGEVTMADPVDLAGVSQPLKAKHRISDMLLVSDAQIDGHVDFAAPLTHDYPVSGTYLSSALLFGDLYARVSNVFDQATWTGAWSDTLIGSEATAQYNTVAYPIEVLNSGAVTERWRLQFTSTTAFQLIGESAGIIATGTTSADFSPASPLTGEPYFVIRSGGWGSGWSVGNNLRFNTYAAGAPIWLARTILPGAALSADSVDIQLRGDVDA